MVTGCRHKHRHGHGKLVLPDYRQWKTERTPLETDQKKLGARGLRDPLAQETWRYTGSFTNSYHFHKNVIKRVQMEICCVMVAAGAGYFLTSKNDKGHH